MSPPSKLFTISKCVLLTLSCGRTITVIVIIIIDTTADSYCWRMEIKKVCKLLFASCQEMHNLQIFLPPFFEQFEYISLSSPKHRFLAKSKANFAFGLRRAFPSPLPNDTALKAIRGHILGSFFLFGPFGIFLPKSGSLILCQLLGTVGINILPILSLRLMLCQEDNSSSTVNLTHEGRVVQHQQQQRPQQRPQPQQKQQQDLFDLSEVLSSLCPTTSASSNSSGSSHNDSGSENEDADIINLCKDAENHCWKMSAFSRSCILRLLFVTPDSEQEAEGDVFVALGALRHCQVLVGVDDDDHGDHGEPEQRALECLRRTMAENGTNLGEK